MQRPPGHLSSVVQVMRESGLESASTQQLAVELLRRVRAEPGPLADIGKLEGRFQDSVFALLANELELASDVHWNRFSRTNLRNHLQWFEDHVPGGLAGIAGKTVVELGCGAANPLGRLFALSMLGAARGIAIDADTVMDPAAACRALARYVSMAALQPQSLLITKQATPQTIASNIADFDLRKLWLGDPTGIPQSRLEFLQRDVERTGLPDASADLVVSFAFLEHVPDVDRAVAELARITKPGGYHLHVIDGTDHASHVDTSIHALDFLRRDPALAMVNGSNRVRPLAFEPHWNRHGLVGLANVPHRRIPVDAALRASFSGPYRSAEQEHLEVASLLTVRRKT